MYGNYVEEEYPEVIDTNLYSDELNGQMIRSEYEETQTILTDSCSQYGITATCFDTHENLLWVGNQLVSIVIIFFSKTSIRITNGKLILFRAMYLHTIVQICRSIQCLGFIRMKKFVLS